MKIRPFLLGIVAAFGAMVVEAMLSNLYFILTGMEISASPITRISFFLILAVLIEESFKFIMICESSTEKKPQANPILNAGLVGLGFAIAEGTLPFLDQANIVDISLLLGVLGIAWVHILTASYIGKLLPQTSSIYRSYPKLIIVPFAIHLIYNLTIIYNFPTALSLGYLAILSVTLLLIARQSGTTKA